MPDKKNVIELDSSELATVFAALRHWQQDCERIEGIGGDSDCFNSMEYAQWHIASEHGIPLDKEAIDTLCKRINCSPSLKPQIVYITVDGGVADIGHAPKGIEVEIVDYDNLEHGGKEEFELYPAESQQWIIDQNRDNLEFLEDTCGVLASDPRLQKK